jgi:hypothetical protein
VTHATITHREVVSNLNTVLYGGDYASFPNSLGGAIVHSNYLVGIHMGLIYVEDEVEVGVEKEVERNGRGKMKSKQRWFFLRKT